jgi:hypothetical protein
VCIKLSITLSHTFQISTLRHHKTHKLRPLDLQIAKQISKVALHIQCGSQNVKPESKTTKSRLSSYTVLVKEGLFFRRHPLSAIPEPDVS